MSDRTPFERIKTIVFGNPLFVNKNGVSGWDVIERDGKCDSLVRHWSHWSSYRWELLSQNLQILSDPINLADLNTSRDWRRDPEDGITEDDIHAPLHEHREHHQDVHEEGHKDSTKKTHKHHHHHKGHHHHHKRKTGSSHSNRISPGGREALESSLPNTPYLPTLPPSEGGGDDDQQPEKAEYNRIPMDDWVRRWEGKKENVKVVWNSDKMCHFWRTAHF